VRRSLNDGEVREILQPTGLDLEQGPEGAAPAEVSFDVQLDHVGDEILLRGELSGQFWTTCSRCLEPALVRVREPKWLCNFLPLESTEPRETDVDLALEDLDASTHDGEQIDLLPLLRETLVLALPIAPLCDDNCRGISSRGISSLGIQAEEAQSRADEQPASTPWKQALEKLKKAPN